MILAEAMIAFAAGTVTEFKVGIVCVGASAYRALAGVALVLCFGISLLSGFFEIDNVGVASAIAASAQGRDRIQQHISAENEIVENCYYGNESKQNVANHEIGDYAKCEICGVKVCQPFYFDRDKEEEQNAAFGDESGKNEKH